MKHWNSQSVRVDNWTAALAIIARNTVCNVLLCGTQVLIDWNSMELLHYLNTNFSQLDFVQIRKSSHNSIYLYKTFSEFHPSSAYNCVGFPASFWLLMGLSNNPSQIGHWVSVAVVSSIPQL